MSALFSVNGYEVVCPACRGKLYLVSGNKLFGVLKCLQCGQLYPLGNYFPGIPDLRPRTLRIEVFEKAWFKIFNVDVDEGISYPKDLNFRVNEVPYFMSLLKEKCSNEYSSALEAQYLNRFRALITSFRRILSVGCGCGRDLRLIGRNELGVDIFPSNIVLANSRGILAILADTRMLPFKDNSFDALLAVESAEYIPVADTSKFIDELSRVLKPKGVALLTLEKCCDGVDKEFYYRYENIHLTVRHFHRCWGTRGLNEVGKRFNIVELDEDNNYYYVLVTKR